MHVTKITSDAAGSIVSTEEMIATDPYSSVEISMDSKGVARPTVKVYSPDPGLAARHALAIYQGLLRDLQAT